MKPYKIICIEPYEFEGVEFKKGDISYNSFGRNIPNGWKKYINDNKRKS
jgi:hypothetical protein